MIFKYRAINKRLIENLVNAEVYFSSPGKLNDPFDCQVNIRKSLDHAIKSAEEETKRSLELMKDHLGDLFDDVESELQKCGVWSCSVELENPLMWAHYGDEHRGICLLYDLPEEFKDHTLGQVIGVSPVDYDKNPIVKFFIEQAGAIKPDNIRGFSTDLIVKLLTSKDKCWEYEKEGRVISREPGLKKIGKSALKQVCFGLRTPDNDKKLIRDILDSHGYEVKITKIDRDDNDFGLKAIEI